MQEMTTQVWNTCGYVRLSREDGDKEESNSVTGQKDLIRDYMSRHPELRECDMKVDDGFTGSNFQRPGFQAMMEEVRAGNINCIVVKDLSRFGRDHLDAGEYIERIFPFLGVRFIAINDNYDSMNSHGESDEIMVPFKNLINEAYCRDTSIKIRSQLAIKRQRGDFIGSFAVFGYQKDPTDHHKLVVDEYAADVVRDIFNWKLEGISAIDIAARLTASGIPTPMNYKLSQGMRYTTAFRTKERSEWSAGMVLRILKNPVYTGVLEQGKVTTPSYKVKRLVKKDRDEWAVVENHHEPIISRRDFDTTQLVLAMDTRTAEAGQPVELFSGMVYCGECGGPMIRKTVPSGGKKYVYYVCGAHKDRKECFPHTLRADALEGIVLEALQGHIQKIIDLSSLMELTDTAKLQQANVQKVQASISNQRDLLLHYIHNSPDLCAASVTEFCDDGWSGKNFDRPAVKELLERTKRGEIQCILVKDISRFGRDYITVGNYITRVFPFLNVRFIAVNDNFDSSRREDIYSLDTSFRALIYDMYSRDASKKVKTAKQRLAKRGVNINPVAPFGYLKDPSDRHKLVPDPRTADIVRQIFTLIADGNTTETAARILNSEGVPPPSRFKAGTSSEHTNWHNNYWCAAAVGRIVRDHQYIGSFVYGKRVRPRIGAHQQLTTDLDDRIIVDDCHEPLVTKELFDKAQEQLGGVMRHYHPTPWDNPLKKKVYCGVCGYAIVRRGKAPPYYLCSRPRTVPGLECWQEKVFEDEIIEAVTEAVRYQAQVAVDIKRLWEQEQSQIEQKQRGFEEQIRECVAEQKALSAESVALYESFVDGSLTHDEYIRQKSGLAEKLEQARRKETEIRSQLSELSTACSEGVMNYQCLLDTDCLTKEQVCELLERVTIFPEGRLEIKLRFVDENKAG